jgi:hypothetical protein
LFSFSALNISLHPVLLFKVSVEKSAVIFIGLPLCYLIFLSYSLQYSFLVLGANCFNYNMLWRGSILVMSAWCPGDFLYLNRHLFLEIWEIFCHYLVEYIIYTFGLSLFSFFKAHDSQFWCFYGVAEFLHILSQVVSLFSKCSSVFSLISVLSLSPESLSSTFSSLLEWLSTVFFI